MEVSQACLFFLCFYDVIFERCITAKKVYDIFGIYVTCMIFVSFSLVIFLYIVTHFLVIFPQSERDFSE